MTSDTALVLMLAVIGLITFGFRLSFIALMDRLRLPPLLNRALRFVPAAALTAIITPELFIQNGAILLSPVNARLIAGVIAIVIAWRTKNTLLTIAAGMVALWVLQLLAR
jgi:branched-subunit amino acid transport protein